MPVGNSVGPIDGESVGAVVGSLVGCTCSKSLSNLFAYFGKSSEIYTNNRDILTSAVVGFVASKVGDTDGDVA